MKSIVLYSSRTGNTKKVAEAIASALPQGTPCLSVKEAPLKVSDYDLVFIGYWAERGNANAEAKKFMETLHNQHVAVFATLGADPHSEHGRMCLENGVKLLPKDTELAGTFICQGAIDPKVIEMMYKMFPAGSPHGRTPERDALHAEAARHPDDTDLARAKAFAEQVVQRVKGEP